MGQDLWQQSSRVQEIFRDASDCTGIDLPTLLFHGTEEELKATDRAQIAITTVNLAAHALLMERGVSCEGAAGHSLGEYSALYAAGVIAFDHLFALVKARGDLMAEASERLQGPDGPAGMAAVLGLSFDQVADLCRSRLHDVYVANNNSPTQVVISGTARGLSAAEAPLRDAGAKRVIPLKVSGPFHSPLIDSARASFAEVIAAYPFGDPKLPVYSNVTGSVVKSGAEAKELCIRQIVSPVLWVEDERAILADGFERCLEPGPGKVLTGLWKSVSDEVKCLPAGTVEHIDGLTGGDAS